VGREDMKVGQWVEIVYTPDNINTYTYDGRIEAVEAYGIKAYGGIVDRDQDAICYYDWQKIKEIKIIKAPVTLDEGDILECEGHHYLWFRDKMWYLKDYIYSYETLIKQLQDGYVKKVDPKREQVAKHVNSLIKDANVKDLYTLNDLASPIHEHKKPKNAGVYTADEDGDWCGR
jgi:hypothetical protein